MTDVSERLSEIRERVEAATEGPWKLWNGYGPLERDGRHRVQRIAPEPYTEDRISAPGGDIAGRKEDLEFIAASRSDVPYLLSLVEDLGEALAQLNEPHFSKVIDAMRYGTDENLRMRQLLTALRDAAQEGAE